ncbi:hypothetical protein D9758_010908 [Tetrapyrgos nigripes]|uniref:Cyclase n=1 Tax=Tetrapyrgos nigripes TaxID=182062 RepID=A0A8H5FTD9_9AGAR|nr:hypothetical protein D9758_010908 [Tetrapyrgos nigripes]
MTTKRLSRILNWMNPSSKDNKDTTKDNKDKAAVAVAKDWKNLPTFDDLPDFKGLKGCAWEVWGQDDELGTVNMLTDEVVKRAAVEEFVTGKCVSLNWPLNFPSSPLFGRKAPEVNMMNKYDRAAVRDDEIHINTQSGSQWDGLRHFGIQEHSVFYNNVHKDTLAVGVVPMSDPSNIDPLITKIGIQNWASHGICGRGVLLDLVKFFTEGSNDKKLPYNPWTTHGFTVADLEACAQKQGVKFRQGDILLVRAGFIQKYHTTSQEERDELIGKPETFAGIEQSEDMKRFLWNNHFAAIASDQPALERWPPPEGVLHMHQTILGLWGMPIGEMFDLEKLSEVCAETGRYTFFFSSWPLAIIGGCASPPNAAVSSIIFAEAELN